jgi:lipopolysaccharide transport system permease protein
MSNELQSAPRWIGNTGLWGAAADNTMADLSTTSVNPSHSHCAVSSSGESWSLVIRPKGRWWQLQLREIWNYRDLLWMFVRRDFVAVYKQTILGPLWFFIQPLVTSLMFTVIFSGIAKISTDSLPPMLFYLAGITPWNYFSTCLNKTSGTFINNAGLFGKVYFPRLITPLSIVVSNLLQFVIQFLLFFVFLAYYFIKGAPVHPDWLIIAWLTPALLLQMALLGLGTGILVSSLTTKYRDLTFLVAFGVQLAMYATPVIYPMDSIPAKYRWCIEANPMSAVIESFRAIYLGGNIPWVQLGISTSVTGLLLLAGLVVFNRVEKTFIDTV